MGVGANAGNCNFKRDHENIFCYGALAISEMWIISCFFYLSTLIICNNAGSVLIMPSSLFPVHRYTMRYLAEELIKRHHEVTWFEYGFDEPTVSLPAGVHEVFFRITLNDQPLTDLYLHRNHSVYRRIWEADFYDEAEQTTAWMASIQLCDQLLSTRKAEFNELVAEKFDTVIVDDLYNPCGLLHTGLQKSVFIYWSMTALRTESAWANQSPSPPSYLPVPGTRLTDELNFWQRTFNMASYLRAIYVHQHLILRRMDNVFQAHYPNRVPEAFYLERNASINFVNTPPIFDFARPYMPRVNFVGGLNCRKAKPLRGELANFVNGADEKHGVILFTTGFTAQWKMAPKTVVDAFVNAFAERSEIRFVWQYNGAPIVNLPSNIFSAEWLPQQDVLGHPKTRAHISHGGLNSVIESVWHGVPLIGFPLTARGYDNVLRITARSAGVILKKKNLSSRSVLHAIDEIYKQKYKDEMAIFQDMVTDVPYTELNHSAFWVEFIQRHQEVPHARSGADQLNVLQYFLVDVITFMLSVLFLVLTLIYYMLKLVFRLICFMC
uniref:glucuronosyltransferase n=4 Tax=Parascaris univalens TaxID=6257 RepID=A0A914ZTH0_PARUN